MLGLRRREMLPRRDANDKSDAVELLVDITYVLALSMAGSLMRYQPGILGVIQAGAVLMAVITMWQYSVLSMTIVSVNVEVCKALMVIQTGLFLALATTIPEAFATRPGGLPGQATFAVMFSLNALCAIAQWALVARGCPSIRRNVAMNQTAFALLAGAVWLSVRASGSAKPAWIFGGIAVFLTVSWSTCLPIYDRFGIGLTEQWHQFGLRAFGERFSASYTVACCLTLELLEQVGYAVRVSAPRLVLVGAALLLSYLVYRLYEPLVEPAYRRLDPETGAESIGQAEAHLFAYMEGHVLMCSGLVIASGAMRSIFESMTDSGHGGFGQPIGTTALVELYGGLAACLIGQAFFSSSTFWRLDRVRLAAPAALIVAIPLLVGAPAVLPPLLALVFIGRLVTWYRSHPAAARAKPAAARVRRGRILAVTSWRPRVRFTLGDHELSGFELLFDVMAAFAFSQTDVLVLGDQTLEGALRGLLILMILWGCWRNFVWAANTAEADTGTIRNCHVIALSGMVFLGMALPQAFSEHGLNARVRVFLAAYLLVRASSAVALRVLLGRTARRPLFVVGAALATAGLVAFSTQLPHRDRIWVWLAGMSFEIAASIAFTRDWTVSAPGHLAERFAFIVIIGLDMSLGGMGRQMNGEPVGSAQLLLIGLALTNCTVMWWLYFSLLRPYAGHRLARTDVATQRREHNRIAYGHFNVLHLVVLTGMVAFGFGLRAIARSLGVGHPGAFGDPLPVLLAIALGTGLAVFTLGIAGMWVVHGRRPHPAILLNAALCLAVIPLTIGRPALVALAMFVALAMAQLLTETLGPRARRERRELAKVMMEHAHPEGRKHELNAGHGNRTGQLMPAPTPMITRWCNDSQSSDRGFDLLDVDGDGVITWRDFTALLHRLRTDPSGADTALVYRAELAYRALWTAMCTAMDLHDDHVITRAEYSAFTTAAAQDSETSAATSELIAQTAGGDATLRTLDSSELDSSSPTLWELVEAELYRLRACLVTEAGHDDGHRPADRLVMSGEQLM